MAFDAYLKIEGIDGEATEAKHSKWIAVDSFHWGVHHNVDSIGSGLSSGKVHADAFTFNKKTDSSSPKIALACCTGEHIKTATIEVSQSSGDRNVWLQYKLSDVLVSSFSIAGTPSSGSDRPEENVAISFSKWEVSYKPTDKGGKLVGNVPAGYDLKLSQKV